MDNEQVEEVKKPSEYALQKAAQAWCKPATQMKIMDAALATAFAEILDEQQNEFAKLIDEAYEEAYQMLLAERSKSKNKTVDYGESIICSFYGLYWRQHRIS